MYQWQGPVKTSDTIFATPLSMLPFQSDAQAPFRFFSWLVVEIETDGRRWTFGMDASLQAAFKKSKSD